jgi:outer membrane lipoprotein-sorting protein
MSRLLVALILLLAQRPGAPALIGTVSETYGRMKDFSAEFVQISKDLSNQTHHERGLVYLKSGRKARFEYESPEKVTEISDGKTFTRFVPAIKQALQMPISKMGGERFLVLQIVGNRESPWKDQFEKYVEGLDQALIPGNRVVRMTPKDKDLREVRTEIDPKTYWIHSIAFTYATGENSEFRFTRMNTKPLEESLFRFVPPPGVVIVRE